MYKKLMAHRQRKDVYPSKLFLWAKKIQEVKYASNEYTSISFERKSTLSFSMHKKLIKLYPVINNGLEIANRWLLVFSNLKYL